jgi:crossover junction endodeoxyribonuclease RuvC
MLIVAAVDPGVTPTIAVIATDGSVSFEEETSIVIKRNRKRRTVPQPHLIANALRRIRPDIVIVEDVQPMGGVKQGRKRGIASTAWFLHSRGLVEGCCAGLGLSYELVTPAVWTKAMGVKPGSGPEGARQRALQLCPALAQALKTKSSHNRAAAYLMARWGLLTIAPKHPLF